MNCALETTMIATRIPVQGRSSVFVLALLYSSHLAFETCAVQSHEVSLGERQLVFIRMDLNYLYRS